MNFDKVLWLYIRAGWIVASLFVRVGEGVFELLFWVNVLLAILSNQI